MVHNTVLLFSLAFLLVEVGAAAGLPPECHAKDSEDEFALLQGHLSVSTMMAKGVHDFDTAGTHKEPLSLSVTTAERMSSNLDTARKMWAVADEEARAQALHQDEKVKQAQHAQIQFFVDRGFSCYTPHGERFLNVSNVSYMEYYDADVVFLQGLAGTMGTNVEFYAGQDDPSVVMMHSHSDVWAEPEAGVRIPGTFVHQQNWIKFTFNDEGKVARMDDWWDPYASGVVRAALAQASAASLSHLQAPASLPAAGSKPVVPPPKGPSMLTTTELMSRNVAAARQYCALLKTPSDRTAQTQIQISKLFADKMTFYVPFSGSFLHETGSYMGAFRAFDMFFAGIKWENARCINFLAAPDNANKVAIEIKLNAWAEKQEGVTLPGTIFPSATQWLKLTFNDEGKIMLYEDWWDPYVSFTLKKAILEAR